jgi:uncharacterized 2Fe-2S/4Fe-4S cluster protein (DUF4445 family)
MGVTASKNPIVSIKNKVKKEETLETTLITKNFRFGFLMDAKKIEVERIQERWNDFITKINDSFTYITTTRYPQTIKVSREGDELFLNVSNKITITEDDLKSLTKMFNSISEKVKEVHQTDSIGLTPSTSSSSSLNLLVKSS